MKINQTKFLSSLGVASMLVLASCGEDETVNTNNDHNDIVADTSGANTDMMIEDVFDPELDYKVPTPSDLFMALESGGKTRRMDILNDPEKAGSYTDKKSKALNFGIYSADLGYIGTSENGSDLVLGYIKAVSDLGEELNISGAMDEVLAEKLQAHVTNGEMDSVLAMSSENYYKAYNYLDKNDRGATLRLVVAGGWIEGLYLLTNMVDQYSKNDPIVQEVANQSLTVESIMGFLNDFAEKDMDVQETMEDMMEIEILLMNLDYADGAEETTTTEDGIAVFSGGDRPVITEEQFNELKSKVAELRNSITGN